MDTEPELVIGPAVDPSPTRIESARTWVRGEATRRTRRRQRRAIALGAAVACVALVVAGLLSTRRGLEHRTFDPVTTTGPLPVDIEVAAVVSTRHGGLVVGERARGLGQRNEVWWLSPDGGAARVGTLPVYDRAFGVHLPDGSLIIGTRCDDPSLGREECPKPVIEATAFDDVGHRLGQSIVVRFANPDDGGMNLAGIDGDVAWVETDGMIVGIAADGKRARSIPKPDDPGDICMVAGRLTALSPGYLVSVWDGKAWRAAPNGRFPDTSTPTASGFCTVDGPVVLDRAGTFDRWTPRRGWVLGHVPEADAWDGRAAHFTSRTRPYRLPSSGRLEYYAAGGMWRPTGLVYPKRPTLLLPYGLTVDDSGSKLLACASGDDDAPTSPVHHTRTICQFAPIPQ